MTPTSNLARLGRTAKPFAWIGGAATVLIVAVALIRRTVGANSLSSSALYMALSAIQIVLAGIAATLFCLSFAATLAVRAMKREVEGRDDEWRRQLILLEIDEPSSVDPPTPDPVIVALAAFTRWYHSSIAVTALLFIAWILLRGFTDIILGIQVNAASFSQLLSQAYAPLGSLSQLAFLTACEMVILLICSRRWVTWDSVVR